MTLFRQNTSSSYKLTSDSLIKRYVSLVLWLYEIPMKEPYLELLRRIFKLRDHSGWSWTVKYLKHSTVSLQHVISGRGKVPINDKSCRVGLRDNGIPCIIPGILRQLILTKDIKHIRATFAILTVFRCINVKGSLKLSTIIKPFTGLSETLNILELKEVLSSSFSTSGVNENGVKTVFTIPMAPKGLETLLTLRTAGPNGKPSILHAPLDAFAFKALPQMGHLLHAIQVLSNSFKSDIYDILLKEMDIVSNWQVSKSKLILSKLSLKPEPAGKVRVFAILDIWSQSVLKPIHDHVFSILKQIPNDGCFDQVKPLQRLMAKGHKDVFSFDLSAATDRLPIMLQTQVVSWLYGLDVALAWKSLLVDRNYWISEKDLTKYGTKSDIVVKESDYYANGFLLRYAVGQPMGALSSWGVFSLTHHVIIQYCARQVGFKTWFDDYALLGDDVVIANKSVADIYLYTMTKVLGVEINLSKSLISNNGTAEFAKQLVSGSVNYTPVGAKNIAQSLKNFANFPSILRDYISKGGVIDNADLQRLIGSLGYNITKTSKKNLSSLLWVIMGPFGFLNTGENRFKPDLFSQSGIPLSPYDMRLRTLSYALDWLIVPIKEVLREDYHKDWKASVEKSAKVLESYRNLATVKGFVNVKAPGNLLEPVGDVRSIDLTPNPKLLPSYRDLFLVSLNKFEELLSKEEPQLNIPYSLPFVEGLRYMLSNIDWPIPETNLLRNQPLIKPRFRPTNKSFFIRVRRQLIKLLKEHEQNQSQDLD